MSDCEDYCGVGGIKLFQSNANVWKFEVTSLKSKGCPNGGRPARNTQTNQLMICSSSSSSDCPSVCDFYIQANYKARFLDTRVCWGKCQQQHCPSMLPHQRFETWKLSYKLKLLS